LIFDSIIVKVIDKNVFFVTYDYALVKTFEILMTFGAAALLYPDLKKEIRELKHMKDTSREYDGSKNIRNLS
jgi:hypothetical protein